MTFLRENMAQDHEKHIENGEHWSPPENDPPPYDQIEPPPPPPSLDTDPGPSRSTTVTPDKCIVHLKFLAALADLRDQVACKDGLFGLFDSEADKFEYTANEAHARVREKRWAVYTARAVKRFTIWWQRVVPSRNRPKVDDFAKKEYSQIVVCKTKVAWTRENMPPLDVMMVLHAYMLNPRAFLEDCIRYGKMQLWASEFPWIMINACINDQTLEYHPGRAAEACFEEKTGLSWDNLEDFPDTSVNCPRCGQSVSVPWINGDMSTSLERAYEHFNGFADKGFEASCFACQFRFNHEKLKLARLRKDIHSLLTYKFPMPGTFLNLDGVPKCEIDPRQNKMSYPNKLVEVLGFTLLRYTDARLKECESISDLAKKLSPSINDRNVLRKVRGTVFAPEPLPQEGTALRRMMSHYWDNHSPFGLDLVGAVIRQGTFVEKMDTIDWLHSPAVQATMERSINKYQVFFRIMAKNPKRMAVPTLDVDLVWHTHQLFPWRYFDFSTSQTLKLGHREIFIDHDDKVEEVRLGDGFEWTSKQYTKETGGGVYSECTCWYCEAIRVPDLHGPSSLLRRTSVMRAREAVANLHNQPDTPPHPNRNPHISSHNAVRAESSLSSYSALRDLKATQLQNNYAKACRRSEKRKSQSGNSRDDPAAASYPLIWGFPCFVPCYAPYMCDPGVHSDAYAGNPACMNVTPGGVGSCVPGTCAGTTAAGACASASCGAVTGGNCGSFGGPAIGYCGAFGGSCGGGGGGGGGGGCGGGGC